MSSSHGLCVVGWRKQMSMSQACNLDACCLLSLCPSFGFGLALSISSCIYGGKYNMACSMLTKCTRLAGSLLSWLSSMVFGLCGIICHLISLASSASIPLPCPFLWPGLEQWEEGSDQVVTCPCQRGSAFNGVWQAAAQAVWSGLVGAHFALLCLYVSSKLSFSFMLYVWWVVWWCLLSKHALFCPFSNLLLYQQPSLSLPSFGAAAFGLLAELISVSVSLAGPIPSLLIYSNN